MRVQTSNLAQARQLLVEALRRVGINAEATSKYEVTANTEKTVFTLSFMPGNRRTLISHGVQVHAQFRGKGIGTQMNQLRELAARQAGVTLMLATVRDDNTAEIRILEKCGWTRLTQNEDTKCSLWGKQLLDEPVGV